MFLADLAGRFDAERHAESEVLVEELTDAERAGVTMAARLLPMGERRLTVMVRGGGRISGRVVDVARTWVLLGEQVGASLVPLSALVAAWPLGRAAVDEDSVSNSVTIGHVLRGLGAHRAVVVVDHDAGVHQGEVLAVYADHFDIAASGGGAGVDSRDVGARTVVSLSVPGLRRIRVPDGIR